MSQQVSEQRWPLSFHNPKLTGHVERYKDDFILRVDAGLGFIYCDILLKRDEALFMAQRLLDAVFDGWDLPQNPCPCCGKQADG